MDSTEGAFVITNAGLYFLVGPDGKSILRVDTGVAVGLDSRIALGSTNRLAVLATPNAIYDLQCNVCMFFLFVVCVRIVNFYIYIYIYMCVCVSVLCVSLGTCLYTYSYAYVKCRYTTRRAFTDHQHLTFYLNRS